MEMDDERTPLSILMTGNGTRSISGDSPLASKSIAIPRSSREGGTSITSMISNRVVFWLHR